jgi:hypothetical protein
MAKASDGPKPEAQPVTTRPKGFAQVIIEQQPGPSVEGVQPLNMAAQELNFSIHCTQDASGQVQMVVKDIVVDANSLYLLSMKFAEMATALRDAAVRMATPEKMVS